MLFHQSDRMSKAIVANQAQKLRFSPWGSLYVPVYMRTPDRGLESGTEGENDRSMVYHAYIMKPIRRLGQATVSTGTKDTMG